VRGLVYQDKALDPAPSGAHTQAMEPVHIIGAGLAGSEAAWHLAAHGVRVIVHEMRPGRMTDAHHTDKCAELVCSNSFRSDDSRANAVGLLHEEMRRAGSLILAEGDKTKLPAGGALAVDREEFSAGVTQKLKDHPLITFVSEDIDGLPDPAWSSVIVATGPLTSPGLSAAVAELTGAGALAFFDAIAPIVHFDSIDLSKAWFQSRYDKPGPAGTGADYLNCPMDKQGYDAFIDALISAETAGFQEWEKDTPYFDGCLPIEVMAARGRETLRHGPMKPVGLTNKHQPDIKPYAVVQLRQDNALGTLFNLVGFQTKMKYGDQVRVLRTIPGLEGAEFARLGGIHRNTYLDSPRLLDESLRLKSDPRLRFAGQITGCEGYVESAAIGLLAARFAAAERLGRPVVFPPETTAFGALLRHITTGHISEEASASKPRSFQPMNINFGLFPPVEFSKKSEDGKRLRGPEKALAKKHAITARALADIETWLKQVPAQAAE